jgi:hypothetical protein
MSNVARRVGQVLLLPFFVVGLIVGLAVVIIVFAWRAGVIGYRAAYDLSTRGA